MQNSRTQRARGRRRCLSSWCALKISVVVPTHNRPRFLREAVASVASQGDTDWELVVVDDGSVPATDRATLDIGPSGTLVLIRHAAAQGVPRAKNAGVRAATGEIILILDDDDLLAPLALARIRDAFAAYPDLDCLFLGVEPFGDQSHNVAQNRRQAIDKVIAIANRQDEVGRCFFDERLFAALVRSVPIDFQRAAARRGTWNIVGGFDEAGLFSESGWAIRAAALCRVALATQVLTYWRIHADNFGGQLGRDAQSARLRQIDNGLAGAHALVDHFRHERIKVRERLTLLESRLSDSHFDKAYALLDLRWIEGAKALIRSFLLRPQLKHGKLILRYLLSLRRRG